jgi:membrane-associated phospholipid phosphatase
VTSTELPPPDAASTPRRVADVVSAASDFGAIWVALALLQVLSRQATPRQVATRLGAAGITSLVLTRWLKHRYAVPRPPAAPTTIARVPTSDRFPSGHTLAAFTAALTVPRRPTGRAIALAVAALVGWARVQVGHHRVVDVVAGASAGTVAGSALAAVLSVISTP